METRKEDGSHYPPKTLYLMLAALLRHSREVQSDPMNFLDRKDVHFKELHGTCDVTFWSLHENGTGVSKKTVSYHHYISIIKLYYCALIRNWWLRE